MSSSLISSATSVGVANGVAVGIANRDEPSITASEVLLPDRQDIIARCELEGPDKNGFAYNQQIWIKYDITEAEVAAQEFAYEHVDQRIFRVPRIYDWFLEGSLCYYGEGQWHNISRVHKTTSG